MHKVTVHIKLDSTCKLLCTVNAHGRYSKTVIHHYGLLQLIESKLVLFSLEKNYCLYISKKIRGAHMRWLCWPSIDGRGSGVWGGERKK